MSEVKEPIKPEKAVEKPKKDIVKKPSLLIAVRIRGVTGVKHDISETLDYLNLKRKNNCVLLDDKPSVVGMLKKAKDFVTWGPVNDDTAKLLKEKRDKGRKTFKLSPPVKGYGKKGIKVPFNVGGALGDRGDAINDLIKRMI